MRHFFFLALIFILTACVSGERGNAPERFTYTITTNRCGNITQMTDARGVVTNYTYLPFGPITSLTYGNTLTFSATYDQDYNPTNRTVSGGLYNYSYDTDPNPNPNPNPNGNII